MENENKENIYMEFDDQRFNTVKGANEGFPVRIFDIETKRDTNLVITVLGKDSDEFLKVSRAQNKKRFAKMTKGGFRNQSNVSVEEIEQDGIELLARCTKSWTRGDKDTAILDGEELKCTYENVLKLYMARPAIKEQIDDAMGDRANFIKS